uniref:Uncharacterized protein n=1 Tax=Heterorhabditis bacteriophora TaxID=37862 RepID=A0A1I7XNW9_HETBA
MPIKEIVYRKCVNNILLQYITIILSYNNNKYLENSLELRILIELYEL